MTGADLEVALGRWVRAGLVSPEQAGAIAAFEEAAAAAPPVPAPPGAAPSPRRRRLPAVAEALGYVGGVLATVGLALVVARYWSDMGGAGRLALTGTATLALLAGGAWVREASHPAAARLRWFLWLGSTAGAGLFAGLAADSVFDVGSPEALTATVSGVVAVYSLALWRNRVRPLQQLTTLGGAAVAAGALAALVAPAGAAGLAVWAAGAAFVLAGLRRLTSSPVLSDVAGALAAVTGSFIVAGDWQSAGLPLVVVTGFGLLAVATVPGLAPRPSDQLAVGIPGGFALLQGGPAVVGYFAQDAAALTGAATWLVGAGLVLVGVRRLTHAPGLVESAGAVAALAGAAVTAGQWPDAAPLLGIATALGLLAVGTLPGQLPMSVLGSLGLLVHVSWAVAELFPGEGRVPLVILVTGALMIAMAVRLSRRGRGAPPAVPGPRHPRRPGPLPGPAH